MQNIIKRNLLKYSAGQHIFCPKCSAVADYRRWVVWTAPSGQTGAHCAACHREILAKVHDDRPHAYLELIGWQFDTLAKFDKPAPKAKPAKPAPKLMTPAAVRRAIVAGHKAHGYYAKKDRIFPTVNPWSTRPAGELIERPATVDYEGREVFYDYPADVLSSPEITARYVAEYCQLNHLTA